MSVLAGFAIWALPEPPESTNEKKGHASVPVRTIDEGSGNRVRIRDALLRLDSLDEEFADNLETQNRYQEKDRSKATS